MGAPFSVHDDRAADPRDAQALDALLSAAARLLSLSRQITEDGATRYAFPHHNSDAAIAKTVGDFSTACQQVRKLVASRALGEECRLSPSPQLLNIELQRCVTKNEERAGFHPLGPVMTAAVRVDAAEASLLPSSRARSVLDRFCDSYQHGFRSPMAG